MAKQATPALNDYFCQKLSTRRWYKLTRVRLSSLNVDISPRYLQSLLLSFRNQFSFLIPPREEPDTRYQAPKLRKLQKLWAQGTLGTNKRLPTWGKLPTSLDALPGNGTGASSPSGEDTQGPSPVDYNLEIEAEFPPAMVIELQKNVALRARKTVIGRTLAGRASFKDLQDCLRLHLPAPFLTVTLLTRGYFEVLFEKRKGLEQQGISR
ncbi:unnamed protein product [Sphagnum balticum]